MWFFCQVWCDWLTHDWVIVVFLSDMVWLVEWLTHDWLICCSSVRHGLIGWLMTDWLTVIVLSGMVWLVDWWLIDWLIDCCSSVKYGLIGWLMTHWLTHWLLLFCLVWSDWLTHDWLIDFVVVLSGMAWLADSWLIDWLCCCSVRYGLIGWLMTDWLTLLLFLSGMAWLADSWLIDWLCCCSVRYGLIGWLMTDWLTLLLFCQVWPERHRGPVHRGTEEIPFVNIEWVTLLFPVIIVSVFCHFQAVQTAMNSNCFLSWLHYAGVWKQTCLLQQSNHVFTDIDQAVHCAEWLALIFGVGGNSCFWC